MYKGIIKNAYPRVCYVRYGYRVFRQLYFVVVTAITFVNIAGRVSLVAYSFVCEAI